MLDNPECLHLRSQQQFASHSTILESQNTHFLSLMVLQILFQLALLANFEPSLLRQKIHRYAPEGFSGLFR